ncbi:MAG TPA: XrtA/PEP-CTERM system histidine kinase PrsK [Woeseiaceae bacterium]
MQTNEIAAIGYAIAMTVFAILTALLLSRWKNSPKSPWIAAASGAVVAWGAILGLQSLGYLPNRLVTIFVEWLRYAAWLAALLAILREIDPSRLAERVASRYGAIVLAIAAVPFAWYVLGSDDPIALVAIAGIGYLMCVLILGALEQIARNAPVDSRSGLNYFCLALTGIFAFDLVPFVLVIAQASTQREYWAARGFVSSLFAVPLSVGIWRSFRLSFDVQFPRQIVFYSFALAAGTLYVVLALMGHYYVETYGGSWGEVAGIVFTVAVIALVAVLAVSASTRARVRVFLMKTFFQYKYDYRKEWLRFIGTLTESGLDNVPAASIRAVAQIVNSPGGVVWVQEREGEPYLAIATWRHAIPTVAPFDEDSSLVRFLRDRQWTVDLEEMKREPGRYEGLELEPWLAVDDWWLIVPLLLGERLSGFILLTRPRVVPSLNFEDHDLLRTVGRHVATHISQAEADRRLAESRQFGTYNRLTAFLMHDLNNLVAQQSLVVQNAERFRDNPQFVDDAIATIAHSVTRMKRLMEQLASRSQEPARKPTDLCDTLRQVIERSRSRQPAPELCLGSGPLTVLADPERLSTAFEHLVRNAQDATDRHGRITVTAEREDGVAHVTIEDTGCGMSPEFVRERLFRPFDSTKGSEAMGIGAYQAREYVRALGGQVEIASEPGIGTTWFIRLPLHLRSHALP